MGIFSLGISTRFSSSLCGGCSRKSRTDTCDGQWWGHKNPNMPLPLSQDLWLQWQQHSAQASSPWKKGIPSFVCCLPDRGAPLETTLKKKKDDLLNKYSLDLVSLLFSNLCQELLSILFLLHLRGCLLLCCACMITQSHKRTSVDAGKGFEVRKKNPISQYASEGIMQWEWSLPMISPVANAVLSLLVAGLDLAAALVLSGICRLLMQIQIQIHTINKSHLITEGVQK